MESATPPRDKPASSATLLRLFSDTWTGVNTESDSAGDDNEITDEIRRKNTIDVTSELQQRFTEEASGHSPLRELLTLLERAATCCYDHGKAIKDARQWLRDSEDLTKTLPTDTDAVEHMCTRCYPNG